MNNTKLRERLSNIWQAPDFTEFFQEFSKKGPINIKKGTILFNEGQTLDNLYFIKEGFVKLYRLSDEGREAIIYLYGPGQILGIRALTSEDESAKHYAEAITNLKILTISRKDYIETVSLNPQYLVDLLHIFIDRLNYTEERLKGFVLTDTTTRVALFLSDCAERFGEKKNNAIELPLDLTHQRIAEFVGSFRETVTLAVAKLEKKEIIKIEKKKVTILDLDKLNKHAGL